MKNLAELKAGQRIVHYDLLRGFFILLALYQHYTGYFNYWMVDYFRESGTTLENYYASFYAYKGVRLPMDDIAAWFSVVFIPWVSQVYLTLAAFNLARRSPKDFPQVFASKVKVYGVLFAIFFFENFLVATSFGHALSFYPIMAWMVILSIIAVGYRLLGVAGVWLLLALSLVRFIAPETWLFSDAFEQFVQYWVHPGFEYDARLEYFFTSGCMGFLLGYLFYHCKTFSWTFPALVGFGVLSMILGYTLGPEFTVDRFDVYATEHDLTRNFWGGVYIWGAQLTVMVAFLWTECLGYKVRLPVVSWVGVSSLLVFGLHRLFFIHIGGPLWSWWQSVWLELPPVNSTWHTWVLMAAFLFWCLLIQRGRILSLIERS